MSSQRTANSQTRGFIHDITSMMLQLKFFDASVTALQHTFKDMSMITRQVVWNERQQTMTLREYVKDLGAFWQQARNIGQRFGVAPSQFKKYADTPLTQLPKP